VQSCMSLLKATSTFGLGRRRWSSPQQCYLHCLHTFDCFLPQNRLHTHTHNRLTALRLRQPRWAGTRRNIHPLTSLVVIRHPLSTNCFLPNWRKSCVCQQCDKSMTFPGLDGLAVLEVATAIIFWHGLMHINPVMPT